MSFATLLNGYALNSTIRLTFSDPESSEGEALATGAEPTRIVFASGYAQSQALSAGVGTRNAYMSPMACEGVAVAPAVDAWRVMTVEASGMGSGATSTGSFTRLAYVKPQQARASAELKPFEPVRLARPLTGPQVKDQTLNGFMLGESAWHDGRSDSFADSTIESQILATRLVTPAKVPISGTATVSPLAYDLTRWMQPRQARNRAISYVKEGLVFKLKVFQQYATGTAIARAHSRGTPNTILAFSITYGEAGMSLAQSAVKIARDAAPERIVAQAHGTGVTAQDHSARGKALATATSHIAPDITRSLDGVRYAYAQGKTAGIASLSAATAVRWPMVRGVRQPARAVLDVTQLVARDMHGKAEADGASLSDPQEAIVTHTVWMMGQGGSAASCLPFEPTVLRKVRGVSQGCSSATGVPWHWVAVAVDGVAQARAEAWGANPRIYTEGAGTGEAEAQLNVTAFKVAYVSGCANAGGATLGEAVNVTRHMRAVRITSTAAARGGYPKITRTSQPTQIEGVATTVATFRNAAIHIQPHQLTGLSRLRLPWAELSGEVGARHLRMTYVERVEPAIAQGVVGRNVFKINADDPAPDWRTLSVPYMNRSHLVAASSREYSV